MASPWTVAGNAYVTGCTDSTDFPTTQPLQPRPGDGRDDAFVAKLNPTGSALSSTPPTWVAASGDVAVGIAIDSCWAMLT